MSTNDDFMSDFGPKLRMRPAVSKICCCSVTAASGFVAAYALVAYAIALIYEIVWIIEAQAGLPVPSALLMLCYCIVIAATVTLVHGLMSKNNRYLLAWLISVILVLIPECSLVFYMSISHWGLQGVYGGAELACYVARLPAVVCGIVLVQSAYAMREARLHHRKKMGGGGDAVDSAGGCQFDASHYVPDPAHARAFQNHAFLEDNGKMREAGSMPDLRRHLASQAGPQMGPAYCPYPGPQLGPQHYPPPPPAYWASLRGPSRPHPGHQTFGTWMGPRTGPYDNYKRRHSVVGAFQVDDFSDGKEYAEIYPDERMDSKSEMGYSFYRPYPYYERPFDPRLPPYGPEYDPRFVGYAGDFKRPEDSSYGVNLYRHDQFGPRGAGGEVGGALGREHGYYGAALRNSHTSVGNESDDLTKYKDVAL